MTHLFTISLGFRFKLDSHCGWKFFWGWEHFRWDHQQPCWKVGFSSPDVCQLASQHVVSCTSHLWCLHCDRRWALSECVSCWGPPSKNKWTYRSWSWLQQMVRASNTYRNRRAQLTSSQWAPISFERRTIWSGCLIKGSLYFRLQLPPNASHAVAWPYSRCARRSLWGELLAWCPIGEVLHNFGVLSNDRHEFCHSQLRPHKDTASGPIFFAYQQFFALDILL